MTEGIQISQRAYTVQILEKFRMQKYKLKLIPLSIGISLFLNNDPKIEKEKEEIRRNFRL